jgi:hypothetical protein
MFRELFNVPVIVEQAPAPAQGLQPPGAARDVAPPGGGPAPQPSPIQREGAFITIQSLVTFPGATAAVTVLANVAAWAVPSWRGQPLLFVIASALVGITIYLIGETDPLKRPATGTERLVGIIIALFNTFVILSAAVGANAMLHSAGAANPAAQHMEASRG